MKGLRGAPLQNNKKNLAQNIRLLIPGAAKDGLLTSWVYFALDEGHWRHLISLLGNKPTKWTGEEPDANSPSPPRSSSQRNGNSPPPSTPPRHHSPPSPSPARNNRSAPTPPSPPKRAGTFASGNPRSGNYGNFDNFQYDVNKVGYTKKDSLGILELPLAAT